jgi:hypothetical protein
MSSPGLSPETLARLEAQLQADLDAVRRVRALLAPVKDAGQPLPPAPALPAVPQFAIPPAAGEKGAAQAADAGTVPPAATPAPYVPPPATAVAVPQVVAMINCEFGLRDVRDMLRQKHLGGHADREIRKVLNKMAKSGALRVVTASRGRGGSTYQRVTQG